MSPAGNALAGPSVDSAVEMGRKRGNENGTAGNEHMGLGIQSRVKKGRGEKLRKARLESLNWNGPETVRPFPAG